MEVHLVKLPGAPDHNPVITKEQTTERRRRRDSPDAIPQTKKVRSAATEGATTFAGTAPCTLAHPKLQQIQRGSVARIKGKHLTELLRRELPVAASEG